MSNDNLHDIMEEDSHHGTQYLTHNNAYSKMSKFGANANQINGGSSIYSSPRDKNSKEQ